MFCKTRISVLNEFSESNRCITQMFVIYVSKYAFFASTHIQRVFTELQLDYGTNIILGINWQYSLEYSQI